MFSEYMCAVKVSPNKYTPMKNDQMLPIFIWILSYTIPVGGRFQGKGRGEDRRNSLRQYGFSISLN